MRISGSTPPLPPVANQARSTRRPGTDAPTQAPAPETPETRAPAGSDKAHGLGRTAEYSHRSDVAALRQWINHPDLRSELALPDLTGEHKGNGFQTAVAAYKAIIAIGNPAPSTDPAPVPEADPVVDPAPAASDPAPVVSDPDPLLDILLPESSPGEEG